MPRIARIETPGLMHHVMIREIERRRIFEDDNDRKNFVERLSWLLSETKVRCYAWAFCRITSIFLLRSNAFGSRL